MGQTNWVLKGQKVVLEANVVDEVGVWKTGVTVNYNVYNSKKGTSVASGTLTEVGTSGLYTKEVLLTKGQYRAVYTATGYVSDFDTIFVTEYKINGGGAVRPLVGQPVITEEDKLKIFEALRELGLNQTQVQAAVAKIQSELNEERLSLREEVFIKEISELRAMLQERPTIIAENSSNFDEIISTTEGKLRDELTSMKSILNELSQREFKIDAADNTEVIKLLSELNDRVSSVSEQTEGNKELLNKILTSTDFTHATEKYINPVDEEEPDLDETFTSDGL